MLSVTCLPFVLHFKDLRGTPFDLLLDFTLIAFHLFIHSFRVRVTEYHTREVCALLRYYLGKQRETFHFSLISSTELDTKVR